MIVKDKEIYIKIQKGHKLVISMLMAITIDIT